jgi:hypothetical protein
VCLPFIFQVAGRKHNGLALNNRATAGRPYDIGNYGKGRKRRQKRKVFLQGFHHFPYDGTNRIRFQGLRLWPLSALCKAPPVKRKSTSTVFVSLLSRVKHVAVGDILWFRCYSVGTQGDHLRFFSRHHIQTTA